MSEIELFIKTLTREEINECVLLLRRIADQIGNPEAAPASLSIASICFEQ